MKTQGFFYDAQRCTGCRVCQVACKEKNKLAAGDFCRRVDALNVKDEWQHFSGACNHCQNPACVAVCPTGAMYKAEDGTVQHRDALCIGCGRCVHSCPYGAVFLDSRTGYAHKCDGCIDRRAEGKLPVCVEACPMRALQFGEMEELRARFGAEHGATLPFLPPEEETGPSLMIRGAAAGRRAERAAAAAAQHPAIDCGAVKVLVLGSGAAAIAAVQTIRSCSKDAEITIVSREKRLSYSRPMLSKGALNSFAMDRYPIVDETWLQENRIDYIGGAEVTELDAAAHTVTLSDGRKLGYDKCIYALGADCFVPPIPGRELQGVFTLRNDRDVHRIRQAMLTARCAAVVGGGITGLELAWELKKAGLAVTVIDVLDRLMDRVLDAHTARLLRQAVEEYGIPAITGAQIRQICGDAAVQHILLEDGTVVPAQLVVLSTGYRANTALASAAGLNVGRAVAVDEKMQTTDPDIYACGDCADRGTATWLQSVQQGQTAGYNVLGASVPYTATPEPVMVHTAGTALLAAGDLGKLEGREYHFLYGRAVYEEKRYYVNPLSGQRKASELTFCFEKDRLCGVAMMGDLRLIRFAEQALEERWDVRQLRKAAAENEVKLYEE